MSEMTGVVQEIQTRDVSGGKKAYNVVIAGQAFGAGLYAPKCKVGDYVKFEIDESRGYKNIARNSLKVSANKPTAEQLAESAATAPKKSTTGASVDQRQDTISRQAALNSATAFMQLLHDADSLGLPAASNKGKRQEALELMLKQYMKEFYEFNTGVAFKDIAPSSAKTETTDAPSEEEVEAPADDQWQ